MAVLSSVAVMLRVIMVLLMACELLLPCETMNTFRVVMLLSPLELVASRWRRRPLRLALTSPTRNSR